MKTIILHPNCSKESATKLAKVLKCEIENPFQMDKRDYRAYDFVINYGCNKNIKAPLILNKPKSVSFCIDKHLTFNILSRVGIPIPAFTTDRETALEWPCTVVRADPKGNQNEGMIYKWRGDDLPYAPLYTRYFTHQKEFRVVVLNGIIVSSYEKVRQDDEWQLIKRDYQYLSTIEDSCKKAAYHLGIGYVGFDVLVNRKTDEFVILEANSAPILTDESVKVFKKLFKRMKNDFIG